MEKERLGEGGRTVDGMEQWISPSVQRGKIRCVVEHNCVEAGESDTFKEGADVPIAENLNRYRAYRLGLA